MYGVIGDAFVIFVVVAVVAVVSLPVLVLSLAFRFVMLLLLLLLLLLFLYLSPLLLLLLLFLQLLLLLFNLHVKGCLYNLYLIEKTSKVSDMTTKKIFMFTLLCFTKKLIIYGLLSMIKLWSF